MFSRPRQARVTPSRESTIALNSASATASNGLSNTLAGELSHLLPTQLPLLSAPAWCLLPIGTAGVPSPTTPTDEPLCRTSIPPDIPTLQGKSISAQQSPIGQGEYCSIASTATDQPIRLDLSCEGLPQPPIKRLSLEMLIHIFYFCIPLADLGSTQTSYPSLWTRDASCNLRRVCRDWKEIVDSLRTVVSVRVGICDLETGGRLFDAIWPTVSGPSHRSTLFLQVGKGRPWDQDVLDRMSGMFSHFKCINIMYYPPSSSVEDLSLSFDDKRCYNSALPQDLHEFSWKSSCNIHVQLPRESRLPWRKLWSAASPETAFPWSYLTYLCLECSLSVKDCFNILLVATKLKSVSFAFVGNTKQSTQSLIVSHSELRSLKVITDDARPFLNLLVLESLRSLDLRTDQLLSCTFPQVGAIPWNILEQLVVHCDMSLEDVRKLLAWCTALKHFEWYCPRCAPTSWPMTLDLGPLSSVTIFTDSLTANVKPLITCLNKSLQQTSVLNLPYIPDFILQSVICPDITTVNVTKAISNRDCWLVFRSCPRLRVLAVFINKSDFTFTRYLDSSPQLTSTSPQLASLAIRSTISLEPLLRCLTLPGLTTLCWDWEVSDVAIFGALQSLLLRSNCPLHRLCLINAYPVVDVLPCLKVVNTSLTELTIDNRTSFDSDLAVTNDILCHLTHGEGAADRCLCPRLRVITLSPVLSDDQVLAKMVRSRWTRGFDTERCQSCSASATFCDLDSLTVGFGLSHEPLHVHPLDRGELAALRKQGLRLQLR